MKEVVAPLLGHVVEKMERAAMEVRTGDAGSNEGKLAMVVAGLEAAALKARIADLRCRCKRGGSRLVQVATVRGGPARCFDAIEMRGGCCKCVKIELFPVKWLRRCRFLTRYEEDGGLLLDEGA